MKINIVGIVLAGGESSRAKTNKLSLDLFGTPLLINTINSIRPFVEYLIVVTGKYDKELKELLKNEDVIVKYNENYLKGMFTSIKCGISNIKDEDVLLIPGDCPLVKEDTIKEIINTKGDKLINVPTYHSNHGHPIFIKNKIVKIIQNSNDDTNLKLIRDINGFNEINVDDKNVLNDVDTIVDYKKLVEGERR